MGASLLFGAQGDRFPLAQAYADLLCNEGIEWGLIGPREGTKVWSRHVAHCALLAAALPADRSLIDVGSGAGLPGLPLAIARPDLRVTLLEPLARRTRFLDLVVERLGLTNVEVLQAKADAAPRAHWDLVTSRAVAPLETLCQWSMPLLVDDGELWAIRGSSASAELEEKAASVAATGALDPEVLTLADARVEGLETLTVVRSRYSAAHVSRETARSPKSSSKPTSKKPRRH